MLSHTLTNKPKLRRIAEEWINYIISPDFQVDVVARTLGYSPVNLAIKDRLTPEEIRSFHINNPNYFKENFIPYKTLDKCTRKAFKFLVYACTGGTNEIVCR